MLALEVKLEEEDQALLSLSSLPSSYNHLATIIMYSKKTLELEDIRQMLHNNIELMKKTYSMEEALGLFIKGQRENQRVGDPKGIQRLIAVSLAIFAKNQGISRKII